MSTKNKKKFILTVVLFILFAAFTVLTAKVDVKPIGPKESEVGLASLNQFVFQLSGVNLFWYHLTDWLGVIAVLTAVGFAVLGMYQLVKRRSLFQVDYRILLLGVYYILVSAVYILFENFVINWRPVILHKSLEASYPSSHTMIVICIMGTAMMLFHHLLAGKKIWIRITDGISLLLMGVTVVGRLISGVHWFTDILGGLILSGAMLMLYSSMVSFVDEKIKRHTQKGSYGIYKLDVYTQELADQHTANERNPGEFSISYYKDLFAQIKAKGNDDGI